MKRYKNPQRIRLPRNRLLDLIKQSAKAMLARKQSVPDMDGQTMLFDQLEQPTESHSEWAT